MWAEPDSLMVFCVLWYQVSQGKTGSHHINVLIAKAEELFVHLIYFQVFDTSSSILQVSLQSIVETFFVDYLELFGKTGPVQI